MTALQLALSSFLLIAGLFFFSTKKKPAWGKELSTPYATVNIISAMSTAVVTGAMSFFADGFMKSLPVILAVTSLFYVFIQSIFTDVQAHKVDRNVIRVATIVPFPFLVATTEGYLHLEWIVALLVCGAMVFFPMIMGPSDGRALLMTAALSYPILGVTLFWYCCIAFILLGFVFILLKTLVDSIRNGGGFVKKLLSKEHYPMVPFILFPHVATIIVLETLSHMG